MIFLFDKAVMRAFSLGRSKIKLPGIMCLRVDPEGARHENDDRGTTRSPLKGNEKLFAADNRSRFMHSRPGMDNRNNARNCPQISAASFLRHKRTLWIKLENVTGRFSKSEN